MRGERKGAEEIRSDAFERFENSVAFRCSEDDTVVGLPRVPLYRRSATPARESLRLRVRIRRRNKSATFGYEKTSDGRGDNRPVSRLGMRPSRSVSLYILSSLFFSTPSPTRHPRSLHQDPDIKWSSLANVTPSTTYRIHTFDSIASLRLFGDSKDSFTES